MAFNWKRILRLIGIGALFAGFFFLIGFYQKYHLPKIKSWLLVEVEEQSQKHLPVRIWPKSVELHLFPVKISFKDVQLLPNEELRQQLAPVSIEQVEVQLSLLGLLKGQVRLSDIRLIRPNIVYISKSASDSPDLKRAKLELPFKISDLFKLPIDAIWIEDLEALVRLDKQGFDFKIEGADLGLENRYNSLLLDLSMPKFLSKEKGKSQSLTLSLDTRFLLEPTEIQLSSLKVTRGEAYLIASGTATGEIEQLRFDDASGEFRTQFQLDEIKNLILAFSPETKIPSLKGFLDLQGRVARLTEDNPVLAFELNGKGLEVEQFILGDLGVRGAIDKNKLQISTGLLSAPAGSVTVSDFETQLGDRGRFQTNLNFKNLKLQELFRQIDLDKIPVWLTGAGDIPCYGDFWPQLKINCKGSISAQELIVKGSLNSKTSIVEIPQMQATGDLKLDKTEVQYSADIKVGKQSKGKSSGKISFEKGFQIDYSADKIDFADIRTLANIDFEGQGQLKGSTQGNSKVATFSMDVTAEDFWIEDFGLGQSQAELRYKDGILNIRKIQGRYGGSRYSGNLALNFDASQLLLNADIPFLDLEDLRSLMQRKYLFPLPISGTGSGQVKVTGPLVFNQLSFNLKSSFFRLNVGAETFDELVVNASATQGLVTADRVQLLKSASAVSLNGQLKPDGALDAIVVGRNLRLEQSEILSQAGLDLTGQADFTMALKGPIRSPRTELFGRLSKVVIGDRPIEDSNFQLLFAADRIQGKGELLGKMLRGELVLPLNESAPFKASIQTEGLDFTHLFSIFSSSARKRDYQTQITSKIDLSSDKGGFWNSTGRILIESAELRRGPLKMTLKEKAAIQMTEGVIRSEGIQFEGDNHFLKLDLDQSRKDQLRASINGKLELGFLSLLTPFMSELRGQLALSLNLSGPITNPSLNGSAFIEEALIKLEDFPHAFENLRADLLFNDKNILVNALRTQLGGGVVTGNGRVQIAGPGNIPIEMNAQFKDVQLNIPDGMRTKGFGVLSVKGSRPPYTLALNYNVESGNITTEFSPENDETGAIRPSVLLPKFVAANTVQPIQLDLDINLVNPINVKNELVDAPIRGRLKISGPPDSLSFNGTLTPGIGGGLFFKDTRFDILTGFVEFQNSPVANPRLYISAQARVEETIQDQSTSDRKNEYDVNLLIQGRVPDYKILLTSQPPLNEQEIVSLLALGMTTASLQENSVSGRSTTSSGIQLGAALLQKPLGKEIKEKTGFEFQISSDTVADVASPKVTLSRQISPKLGASASRTIETNPKNSVKLEYRVNRNVSVIGSWESQEQLENVNTDTVSSQNKLGLDLEYKVNFK